ncbi:MAG: Ig-like domain-containing protein, partial [Acidobacteria bacterium]|nr:Ig-like domain-containing protein [Acidobacteriota bacterium]
MHTCARRLGFIVFLAALLFTGILGCGKETVTSLPPVASALNPTSGATGVPINQAVAASFSETMNAATISSSSFTLAGPTGPVAGAVTYTATGSVAMFTPSAYLAYNTVYTATIATSAANTLGIQLASTYTWSFTTMAPPPTVVSTVPSNGATGVPIGQVLSASFSEAMNPATIGTSSFTLTGPTGNIAGSVAYNASSASATFTPSAPLTNSTLYTATISTAAQSLAGTGLASTYSWTFTTVAPPLAVVSVVPVNGATGVPVNQALTATFNLPLNCATLAAPAANFIVTAPNMAAVAGSVTCSGNVATFTPSSNLAYSTLYTATITTGAADTAGTVLPGNYMWSFITVPAPTPPTVISTVPANLAVNVPINQAVLATFSEAMTASTIDSNTFTLTGPGAAAVTGTVTYTASGSVATFTPKTNLAYSTMYTATVTTGVTGLTGAAMASNFVWTFTTAAAPVITGPAVVTTIPANLATNVPLNQIVSANFSQPMNPTTINSTNFTLKTGGTSVAGIVAYAAVGNALTFTPAAALTPSTQYTATITTGVTNLSGIGLATN